MSYRSSRYLVTGKSLEIISEGKTHLRIGDEQFTWYINHYAGFHVLIINKDKAVVVCTQCRGWNKVSRTLRTINGGESFQQVLLRIGIQAK
jgi:hypothetical protein